MVVIVWSWLEWNEIKFDVMLKFEDSPEEEFWKVKMERYIDECSSVDELKQIAKLLVNLSATRQVAIKALVKENLDQWESKMGIRAKWILGCTCH